MVNRLAYAIRFDLVLHDAREQQFCCSECGELSPVPGFEAPGRMMYLPGELTSSMTDFYSHLASRS